MVLQDNRYWGTKVGCFPANEQGLTTGTAYVDPQAIYQAWTPNLRSSLSSDDLKMLESYALSVKTELERLKDLGKGALNIWDSFAKVVAKAGGKLTSEVNTAWANAQASLNAMGAQRERSFKLLDKLMVYSPSPSLAQQLCEKKLAAFEKHRGIVDEIAIIHRNINEKITSYYQQRDDFLGRIQQLLEQFLSLLSDLIMLVVKGFEAGFYLVEWAKNHPKISLAVGGVLGLLILGLILRPYFTILSTVVSKVA